MSSTIPIGSELASKTHIKRSPLCTKSFKSPSSPSSSPRDPVSICPIFLSIKLTTNKEKCSALSSTDFSSSLTSTSPNFSGSASGSSKWNTASSLPFARIFNLSKLTLTSPFSLLGCSSSPSASRTEISKIKLSRSSASSSFSFSSTFSSTFFLSTF